MLVLSGAALVLPHRIVSPGSLAIDEGRIVGVEPGRRPAAPGPDILDLDGHYVVPGFIDVHVHGVDGRDALDGPGAVAVMAEALPRHGVVGFCPTTVACGPEGIRLVLMAARRARVEPSPRGARVLPVHLESCFLNPAYRGAHPPGCLRRPPLRTDEGWIEPEGGAASADDFSGVDVLFEIERGRADIAAVTLAPELPGAIDLIRHLAGLGVRVSLGHSGATFEQAREAVAAGARRATHLFNRMAPLHHRDPGLAGAVLQGEEVAAEIIADGYHVHPGIVRMAVAAKQPARVMAVTDGTAAAGLAPGARATLGGMDITAREQAAFLDDGTLAGSTATMDRVFRTLVTAVGLGLPEAAMLCATTPARELGLHGYGVLTAGAAADLTVLDDQFQVVQTYIGGVLAYSRA